METLIRPFLIVFLIPGIRLLTFKPLNSVGTYLEISLFVGILGDILRKIYQEKMSPHFGYISMKR